MSRRLATAADLEQERLHLLGTGYRFPEPVPGQSDLPYNSVVVRQRGT